MKKVIIGFVGVVALLALLGGCGSGTNTTSTDTSVSVPAPASEPAPVVTPKEQFLSDINSLGDPIIANIPDENLWSMATATCSALDKGNSITYLINYLIASGTMTNDNAQTIGEIIGASVKDLCPSHTQELQDFINQNSSSY